MINYKYENIESLNNLIREIADNPVNYIEMRQNRELFEIKNYKVNYKTEYLDNYDDIEYYMKRNQFERVKMKLKEI